MIKFIKSNKEFTYEINSSNLKIHIQKTAYKGGVEKHQIDSSVRIGFGTRSGSACLRVRMRQTRNSTTSSLSHSKWGSKRKQVLATEPPLLP